MADYQEKTGTTVDKRAVVERFVAALNDHDIDSFVACFAPDYRSEQPAHPDRAFGGRDQVRQNWSMLFRDLPDIHADLLRTAVEADTVWAELRIHGHRSDGSELDLRGVIVHGIRDDQVGWARLYLEDTERGARGIDEAVRRMASGRDAADQ
jgi:ketosteroid isomerase-like protein